jgi:hypothetical protein
MTGESAEKELAPVKSATNPMNEIRYTEEGLQVPVGNGGSTKRYIWTQTINETSVLVAVPVGTKGKDLSVSLKLSSITVRMKKAVEGEDEPRTLLEGDSAENIRIDESTWSLEGGVLLWTLDKLKMTWWDTVLIGDEKIDTTLVDSRRHIDEYDESLTNPRREPFAKSSLTNDKSRWVCQLWMRYWGRFQRSLHYQKESTSLTS